MSTPAGWALLTLILMLAAPGVGIRPGEPQGAPEVRVTIERGRLVPAEMRARSGRAFVLVVTNADDRVHELEIEKLDIERRIGVGQTVRIPVPALAPGRYDVEDDDSIPPLKGVLVVD